MLFNFEGWRIIEGPCAIRVGKYWVGVASGNRRSCNYRRTVEKALEDAKKLELEIDAYNGSK